jgi:hypothetical protein
MVYLFIVLSFLPQNTVVMPHPIVITIIPLQYNLVIIDGHFQRPHFLAFIIQLNIIIFQFYNFLP